MLRPSISRRFLVLAVAVTAGAGVGLGAAAIWSASGADAPQTLRAGAAESVVTTAPAPVPPGVQPAPVAAPAPLPLTLDEAKAVAGRVAPGRIVEADEDDDPPARRFEVTLLHDDGTVTEVEVDAATGAVVSITSDDHWDGS